MSIEQVLVYYKLGTKHELDILNYASRETALRTAYAMAGQDYDAARIEQEEMQEQKDKFGDEPDVEGLKRLSNMKIGRS